MLTIHVYVVAILLFTHYGYSQKQGDSCIIEHTNTLGFCVPAVICQSARRDYEVNGIRPTICNSSIINIMICCGNESLLEASKNEHEPMLSYTKQNTTDNRRISEKKCEEYSSRMSHIVPYIALVPNPKNISISIPKCDYSGVELILGGETANTGEFPHMAAIGWANVEGSYSFLCGGSLISTKYVLTAAHCSKHPRMKDPNPVIVRLGDRNLDPTKNDGANPIEVPIKNIRNHPLFKSPSIYNDIALLELESDIDISDDIRPVCLWNKPDVSGHARAVAAGWEVVNPPTLRTTNELLKVSLSLLENDFCNHLLQSQKNVHWYNLRSDRQLCAADLRGGIHTCQAPGSPLQVVSHENRCVFHLIGVTSFGYKCAQSGSPAVYTRVSSYLDWIESVVWPEEP